MGSFEKLLQECSIPFTKGFGSRRASATLAGSRLGAPAPNSAVPIADYLMYGLPPAPRGQTYYVEGRQILRVDRRDRTVLEILSLAKLLGQ